MRTQVICNRESLITAHMPNGIAKVRNGAAPPLGELIVLVPGTNLIDSEKLKKLRTTSPAFEALFKTRIEPSPAPEQNPECVGKYILVQGLDMEDEAPLSKLTPAQAEAVVVETFQEPLLDSWLVVETRPQVRTAIARQLKTLRVPRAAAGAKLKDE